MKDAVILQYSTSLEFSSLLIRRLTHSPFSHVDFVLDDGSLLGASDSPNARFLNGNPRGVAVRIPEYQQFGIRRRAVIRTPLAERIIARAYSQIGKPFDNDALYSFLAPAEVTPKPWHDVGQWFCTEYAVWCFWAEQFFPYELVTPLDRIAPRESLLIFNPYMDVDSFIKPVPGLALGLHEA